MAKSSSRLNERFMRRLSVVAVAILAFSPIAGHAAGILSGRYTGVAIDSAIFNPPYGNFDGSPIGGEFLIALADCTPSAPAPVPGACLTSSAFLTADVPGQPTTFGVPNTLVSVENTSTTQRLYFSFGFNDPYTSARLELVGGVNAFIDGTDYSSLHAGEIALAQSTLTLMGGRTYRTAVTLNSFELDQVSGTVPDVPTWGLLLVGFAMTGMATRRRQRSTGCASATKPFRQD